VFENLIESKQKSQRTLGQTILSLLVHGLIVVGAVKATQGVAESIKNRPVDTTMVFLKPPEPPKPPPEQTPPDVIVAANPPPKGFQTVVAPTDIPKDIPPIDLNEKPFDPKDFTGKASKEARAPGSRGEPGRSPARSSSRRSWTIPSRSSPSRSPAIRRSWPAPESRDGWRCSSSWTPPVTWSRRRSRS